MANPFFGSISRIALQGGVDGPRRHAPSRKHSRRSASAKWRQPSAAACASPSARSCAAWMNSRPPAPWRSSSSLDSSSGPHCGVRSSTSSGLLGGGAIAERGEMRAPHAAHVLNAALAHTRLLHTPKARSSKCREMGSQGRAGEERFCWRTCASAHPPSARTPRAAALREAVGRRAPRSCPASPRPRRRPARRSAGSARCCRAAQAGSRRPARRAARSGRAARC